MIRPLFDRIVVRRLEEAEPKDKPLIVLPDASKEKPTRALVLAAGPGLPHDAPVVVAGYTQYRRRPMSVQVGQVVLFGKYTGQEIEVDGEKLLIMREEDVLAVEDEFHVA